MTDAIDRTFTGVCTDCGKWTCDHVDETVAALRAEIEKYEKDLVDAAGELLIDIALAPPGTVMAKLLIANRLLVKENARLLARYHEDVDGAISAKMSAESENRSLRRQLWLRHAGGRHQLYGDDGEMQCSTCIFDFKRAHIDEVLAMT